MEKISIICFICWMIVLILVNMSWQVKNEKVARVLLGCTIILTFIYAAFYGGKIS